MNTQIDVLEIKAHLFGGLNLEESLRYMLWSFDYDPLEHEYNDDRHFDSISKISEAQRIVEEWWDEDHHVDSNEEARVATIDRLKDVVKLVEKKFTFK